MDKLVFAEGIGEAIINRRDEDETLCPAWSLLLDRIDMILGILCFLSFVPSVPSGLRPCGEETEKA